MKTGTIRAEAKGHRVASRRPGACAGEEAEVEMRNLQGPSRQQQEEEALCRGVSGQGWHWPAVSGCRPLGQASSHAAACETVGQGAAPGWDQTQRKPAGAARRLPTGWPIAVGGRSQGGRHPSVSPPSLMSRALHHPRVPKIPCCPPLHAREARWGRGDRGKGDTGQSQRRPSKGCENAGAQVKAESPWRRKQPG